MSDGSKNVALLWRGSDAEREAMSSGEVRHPLIAQALADADLRVTPIIYSDSAVDAVRGELLGVDAVLVWVDPVSSHGDRETLDQLLREVSKKGTQVFTHPDTIMKMGTKGVLYRTRALTWSTETHLYPDFGTFSALFPVQLESGVARVLKQSRGNGGIGVWKVQVVDQDDDLVTTTSGPPERLVRLQHAAPRDGTTEDITIGEFMARMEPYFNDSGYLIEQAFVDRVADGMVRAYLVQDRVVGFARQFAPSDVDDPKAVPRSRVFGIPAPKTMFGANEIQFQRLRERLEGEWVPALMNCVQLSFDELPMLWDADFLFGPLDERGHDTYLLCEINVSCVSPFPNDAPLAVATALKERLLREATT